MVRMKKVVRFHFFCIRYEVRLNRRISPFMLPKIVSIGKMSGCVLLVLITMKKKRYSIESKKTPTELKLCFEEVDRKKFLSPQDGEIVAVQTLDLITLPESLKNTRSRCELLLATRQILFYHAEFCRRMSGGSNHQSEAPHHHSSLW